MAAMAASVSSFQVAFVSLVKKLDPLEGFGSMYQTHLCFQEAARSAKGKSASSSQGFGKKGSGARPAVLGRNVGRVSKVPTERMPRGSWDFGAGDWAALSR